jgi:SAM-dependent methyltransferase
MAGAPLYDTIGQTYTATRQSDPRIAAQIADALGDAASVVNVGAGTGSYEPPQTIAAIDPSLTMLRQRPPGAAPALRGVAEHLPLRDNCADAAMTSLSVHHWTDIAAGVAEMCRVARRRVVFFISDISIISKFWLLTEYLPHTAETELKQAVYQERLAGMLDRPRVVPVPVPHDCVDGFGAAYWRRPEAYLDPRVQAGISLLAKSDRDKLADGLGRLAADLASGRWHRDHAHLLERDSLDLGYCLVIGDA